MVAHAKKEVINPIVYADTKEQIEKLAEKLIKVYSATRYELRTKYEQKKRKKYVYLIWEETNEILPVNVFPTEGEAPHISRNDNPKDNLYLGV